MTRSTMNSLAILTICASAGAAAGQVCEPRWSDEFEVGADSVVRALHYTPEALYVGGSFVSAGGVATARIAAYDGGDWIPLGRGFTFGTGCHGAPPHVSSLVETDLPGAGGLIAGGAIADASGIETEGIARWDGDSWQPMGSDGLAIRFCADCCAEVRDMVIFDDGSGPALYAGGDFDTPAHGAARWNGADWEQVGDGAFLFGQALQVHDDGSGAALYLATLFAIHFWNGDAWGAISNPGFPAEAMIEHEIAGRTALVAGGGRDARGGDPAVGRVAWWDGATWNRLGAEFDGVVRALAVFDDGTGPALYAGGEFRSYDGRPIGGLAKWDAPAGEWVLAAGGVDGSVYALEPAPHEGAWSLVVGGGFETVGASGSPGVPSQNIARLIGCAPAGCYADCDGDGELTFFDFLCFQNEFAAQTPYADCDQSGAHDFFDFLCFQNAFASGCS